ncbi:hypothetical protein [Bacillus sp. BB51/4]|uniref:hypothetical protein n=1 Tax=Bacillus cereus group TaxID=86661 RepID=UPI00351BE8A3
MSGYDTKLDHAVDRYITNVFCYGCNLGPTQTARSLSVFIVNKLLGLINGM